MKVQSLPWFVSNESSTAEFTKSKGMKLLHYYKDGVSSEAYN